MKVEYDYFLNSATSRRLGRRDFLCISCLFFLFSAKNNPVRFNIHKNGNIKKFFSNIFHYFFFPQLRNSLLECTSCLPNCSLVKRYLFPSINTKETLLN